MFCDDLCTYNRQSIPWLDTYSKVLDVLPKGAYNDDFDHRTANRLIWIDKHPHQTTSIVSYAMTYVTLYNIISAQIRRGTALPLSTAQQGMSQCNT